MKFKVYNKNSGNFFKKKILNFNSDFDNDFISLAHVKNLLGVDVEKGDLDSGWSPKLLRLERKIRVRETKEGWFLYLPEPNKTREITSITVDKGQTASFLSNNNEDADRRFVDYLMDKAFEAMKLARDARRPVFVVHKKGKKEEKRYGLFHCWATNRIVKEDEIIDQLLAVVEFPDGHVERIDFKNIFFDFYEEV